MKHNRDNKILLIVFLIVLFYVSVEHFEIIKKIVTFLYEAISPLIYGVVIAFILNLIVVRLEKYMTHKIFSNQIFKRTISITGAFMILTGIIVIVCFNVIPGIMDSARQIMERMPHAVETGIAFLDHEFGISIKEFEFDKLKLDADMIDNMFGLIENESFLEAIKASGNVVEGVISVITKLFIGIFFALYILAKKEEIMKAMKQLMHTYLPQKVENKILYFGSIIYDTYANFISGQCVDAMILGCLLGGVMGVMRLPYAVLISVVVAVTALVPVVGALVGGTIGFVLLLMVSPIKAITFLVIFLVLQQIDNRLIYPHIVGNAIGIPSILIFAAIIIGGEFHGVIGMFLGIPFTAVIYTIILDDMKKRKKLKEKSAETSEKVKKKVEEVE